MDDITIERAFSEALAFAEEQHGRGFQAKICKMTGVDSSNLNSIMRHEKGTKEVVRREIFDAVVAIVPGIEPRTYEDFLALGRTRVMGVTSQTITQHAPTSSPAVNAANVGRVSINIEGPGQGHQVTLSDVEMEVLTLFRKYGNPALLERCLGQLRQAEAIFR